MPMKPATRLWADALPGLALAGSTSLAGAARPIIVLNSNDADVSIIDGASFKELRRLPTGKEPHHLYLAPDEKTSIVANAPSNSLTFIDIENKQVVRQVGVGRSHRGVWTLALVAGPASACERPVYLTFDTGHMVVAPPVAELLQRHAFGSDTWDHDVWQADTAAGLRVRPTQGAQAGTTRVLDIAAYCAELQRPAERLRAMAGVGMGSIFRAPGGKTSPAMVKAAASCGWTDVGWSPAGLSGDELPSDKYPTEALLKGMLRDVKQGDVLRVHLGIWSRKEPWAPAALEPLIVGLKARGLCFATLREHPQFAAAAARLR